MESIRELVAAAVRAWFNNQPFALPDDVSPEVVLAVQHFMHYADIYERVFNGSEHYESTFVGNTLPEVGETLLRDFDRVLKDLVCQLCRTKKPDDLKKADFYFPLLTEPYSWCVAALELARAHTRNGRKDVASNLVREVAEKVALLPNTEAFSTRQTDQFMASAVQTAYHANDMALTRQCLRLIAMKEFRADMMVEAFVEFKYRTNYSLDYVADYLLEGEKEITRKLFFPSK